ncbi:MAG TPA: MYXO-CTERM sorting domain-containing protein [Myxococcota bacterium]|nr:hypothetical protein [Myxococcota bacterium]HNZ03470.1 MYXO-CTERM sorting domain-containing protein [Myxococcota bacterium]HOD08622.1 MYXO-CTERM sorting domain-containing protein [Myxococcota bacterium]HPB51115.1 MYXO-CTERM sorting domain-containing protein [Myxococcota bacterium]HQP96068.1 MYXO-CTERM sorting domain-containing protein [Myxococcota bacterium]
MKTSVAGYCMVAMAALAFCAAPAYATKFRFPVIDVERIQFEIPDFSDHDGDNGSFSDVIVTPDVYEDVVGEVWPDVDPDVVSDTRFDGDDTPWSETSVDLWDEAWESEFGGREFGWESVDFDTAIGADLSIDAAPSVDSGNGGRDEADSAGGCSSTGTAVASNGLMLLFGAGILAMFLRRRRAFH